MGIQDRDYMRGKAGEGESRLEFPEFRRKWWRRINIRTALAERELDRVKLDCDS